MSPTQQELAGVLHKQICKLHKILQNIKLHLKQELIFSLLYH